MPEIRAAGFIVYRRREGTPEYLTLRTRKTREWGLPKGHHEPGETDLEAAWRETGEETGLGTEQLLRNPWFERRIDYPVRRGEKTVYYGLAEWAAGDVTLSREHTDFEWTALDDARNRLPHENLKRVVQDAATFLKDPTLRRGLDPAGAAALLKQHFDKNEPVLAHTALVAEMARAIANVWPSVDAEFTEACAWLHDIGRSVDHKNHPLEGFRLLVSLGHEGYAPTCISHFTKGRSHTEVPRDELWRACDLATFEPHERIVALADFLAVHETRGTIEQRHEDLTRRYGASPFLDQSLAIARALKDEFEKRTGKQLYEVAGVGS